MPEHEQAVRREAMSPDDIAAFHRWKNEETARAMVRSVTEMVICEVWDVQYSVDGRHWSELRRRREAINRLLKEQGESDDRRGTFRRAAWEKVATLVAGAAAALGVGWLSKRTGVILPGAAP